MPPPEQKQPTYYFVASKKLRLRNCNNKQRTRFKVGMFMLHTFDLAPTRIESLKKLPLLICAATLLLSKKIVVTTESNHSQCPPWAKLAANSYYQTFML